MIQPHVLIGQGGLPPLVNDYAAPSVNEVGPQFVHVTEIHGSDAPGTPSYKVAKYIAAQTGKRGDSLLPVNIVIQRNAGDPKSDQIGVEINVNNNGEPMTRDEIHWLNGVNIGSGGNTHPGVGAHIGSTGTHNAFITGLRIDGAKEVTVALTQSESGEGILIRRNNDTNYKGWAFRFTTADGSATLFGVDFDGSVWCRGNKVIG